VNRYDSTERRIVARNVYEGTIAPPADLSIAAGSWVQQPFHVGYNYLGGAIYSSEGNLFLKRVGLFSNFADGLVPKTPARSLIVRIEPGRYFVNPTPAGSVTFTAGSKTVTGIGTTFTADLPAGSIVQSQSNYIYRVASLDGVNPDTVAYLSDYALYTEPGVIYNCLTSAVSAIYALSFGFRTLNEMVPVEKYMPVSSIGAVGTKIILQAAVSSSDGGNMDFLTKSIDSLFAGDTAFFDVQAEIEYSAGSSFI
jgi:hypothetical protein